MERKVNYFFKQVVKQTKAMRSVKDYASYAKTAEFRVIPTSGITVINGIIPLR